MNKLTYSLLAFIITFFATFAYADNDLNLDKITAAIPEFEGYIQKGMQQAHVPGLAVAIVYNNKVVYIKGFGVRELGDNQPVTPDTVFQIASLSKPLTSTVLAAAVADKKIQWDTPIRYLDPNFQLIDPWITQHLTIRDLLSHTSGLPDHAGDILEDYGFTQAEILHNLRYLNLNSFRASYAYTNFGFTEAALATAKAYDMTWDELVRQKLLIPLNMQSTSTTYAGFLAQKNRAIPHVIINNEARPLYQRNADAQAPAGGFSTSMNDMTKWMLLQLNDGKYHGKQIIPTEILQQSRMPVFAANVSPEGQVYFYGLGWGIKYDNGNTILSHSGEFSLGIRSFVKLIPTQHFGIAIFTNAAITGLPEALDEVFMDLLNQKKIPTNWLTIWNERLSSLTDNHKPTFATPKNLASILPLKVYTGIYHNTYFGKLFVSIQEGKLTLTIGPQKLMLPLQPWNRDVFMLQTIGENKSGLSPVIFTMNNSGIPKSLYIQAFDTEGFGNFTKLQS